MEASLVGRSLEAYWALRKKLIDTTLRNRMINYRPPGNRSAVGLEIREGHSQTVWDLLVAEPRKKLGFTGPPDPAQKNQNELPELTQPVVVHDVADLVLNSPTPKSKRETRLLGTYRAAQEQLEERGVNTLFLTLGMLEWSEPASNEAHKAPLILVPVTLERTPRGDFRLSYEEGEISTNLSLSVKLEEYGVSLAEIPSDLERFAPSDYFREVATSTANHEQWTVNEDEIALNFFSFEKTALFVDLDPVKWPEGKTPLQDSDINAILGEGYGPGESPLSDDTLVDDLRTASEEREVFQADSSQLLAILEASRGTSMVIEGPPGTGKSQTIANLVAEMVSQGKKVLFVSEKMAALDVVFRRLEEAGLGEAALKLHGQKANRRSFYEALKSTWFRQSRLTEATHQLERLTNIRNHLNRYVKELHRPVKPSGVAPRRLLSIASCLPASSQEDLDSGYDPGPLSLTNWEDMQRAMEDVSLIQDKVRQIGMPCQHPFWGSQLEFFGPDERHVAERAINLGITSMSALLLASEELSQTLGVALPASLDQIAVLHRCAEIALGAPPLDGIALRLGTWRQNESRIRRAISELARYRGLRSQYGARLLPTAWERDWTATQLAVTRRADSFFGRFSGEYRQAANELRAHCIAGPKIDPASAKEFAQMLFEAQGLKLNLLEFESSAKTFFGVQWQGIDSDPVQIETLLEWVLKVENDVDAGLIPRSLLQFFNGEMHSEELREASLKVRQLESETRERLVQLYAALKISTGKLFENPISQIRGCLESWQENISRASDIVSWNLIAKDTRERNLSSVLILASRWPEAATSLTTHVMRHWAHANIRRAFEERPSLAKFERLQHEQMIGEFGRLDDLALKHNRARVAHSHLSSLPGAASVGLTAELFRQCELKRGHKPIRWAFERFGDLILQIKPICMMSPLSVATFLPRTLELFDVVIFDEASQVKPEDALSAIARARQAVVVGDSKQMPPTSFFDSLARDEAGEEEDYDVAIGQMESILALCSAGVQNSFRRRYLKWHYRSLHQSLIQPSNRLFYEDSLVVFPSPLFAAEAAQSDLGLRFNFDPSAVYDRGAVRKINQSQAEQVAKAAVQNLRVRPHESLMVVAFSKDQQQAIWDSFERLRANEPGLLAEYESKHPFEEFKVKNLETVQGDERDVVLISVGYGRDAKGAISMNFGPLNKESGGRRLNVLMSRSRKRTEVFSSIRGGDIVIDDQRENGLKALKVFLEFAETGLLEDRSPSGHEEESEFEVQVKSAIEARGYSLDPQVGSAGFRIDLAVRHPKQPGRYVLGIECDGATYHSARSARDRDKLRQLVLESRGWRIHRIWSTDWWMNRGEALARALAAIEQAIEFDNPTIDSPPDVERTSSPGPSLEVWQAPVELHDEPGAKYQVWNRPFQLNGIELHDLQPEVMARCVQTVVAFEGPIHTDLLVKRIRDSAGKGRAGNRIRDAILAGTKAAETQQLILRRGDFLYWTGGTEVQARSRADVPASEKAIQFVASEELDDAILRILRRCRAAPLNDLVEGVKKLLGFSRMPDELPPLAKARLLHLNQTKKICFDGVTALSV